MSAFRFRLARLLRVRAVEERLARERWLAGELAARDAEGRAASARAEMAAGIDHLRAQQSSTSLAPEFVLASATAIERLRDRRRTALERARTARFQADELRRAWLVREQEKKGLERLETRDRELHVRSENDKETRALDEVASMRADRLARSAAARPIADPGSDS